ncbi:MAG: TonB-dependent receptor [Prevotella sp.]|nr:TonB-dependent receptor [Prevotella sp.]MDD7317648.1 TonB-dependent receptor [Prevotellaceae bacterium]MDY4020505.1 TonB-dependent receptor [Prevotella sp.]
MQNVTVLGNTSQRNLIMKSSQNMVRVTEDFINENLGGSLMQSLQTIPGVKAMSIGSGESKPTIRGLGFNRMAVTENGIKHEGQQWGEDHGLEINQFDIDRVEIVKGPSALLCGSDAIGGVINLYSDRVPQRSFEGKARIFARSNNASLGAAVQLGGAPGNGFYWKLSLSGSDYADYKVPTDSIQYYSYYIKLHKHRLRNTAGRELDGSVMLGYQGANFSTSLRLSDTNGKSGFFANAHGLEVRLSEIDYDRSERDISLPYHSVNHLKAVSHSELHRPNLHLSLDLSFQHNMRREESEPVSHGYMPKPESSLERKFNKTTYTVMAGAKTLVAEHHNLSMGVSAELQRNKRYGWGFIIPDFRNATAGAYIYDRYHVSERLILNAGLRYDLTRTHIYEYTDWFTTPENDVPTYKKRSENRVLNFGSLTWSAGVNYILGNWILKANVGKGFRTPIAKELGTDGVNYHIFRYERGNADLDPEESYQVDAGINWQGKRLSLQFDPYFNYFTNYIYMNPTSEYYEGLQVYNYSQSKVLRWGCEVMMKYEWMPWLESELTGEYLYARQQSGAKKGYTLPFSRPWSAGLTLRWKSEDDENKGAAFAQLTYQITGRQSEIVPPEKPTPGYYLIGLSAGKTWNLKGVTLSANMQCNNLLNRRYYDHTSYYRLIGVSEAGRNVSLSVGLEF